MMKAIEGSNLYDLVKETEMCFVSNVTVLKEFRVPEFVKYTGNQFPMTYLKSYYNKIAKVIDAEKMLILFFQDILSDFALILYKAWQY